MSRLIVAGANRLALILGTGFLIAFLIVSYFRLPPYDYLILMRGADTFCFHNELFQFGISVEQVERNFYPGRTFADTADLNRQMIRWCEKVNAKGRRHL